MTVKHGLRWFVRVEHKVVTDWITHCTTVVNRAVKEHVNSFGLCQEDAQVQSSGRKTVKVATI